MFMEGLNMAMTIKETVKKYNIRIADETQLACDKSIAKNKEAVNFVMKHKQEIMEFIKAEQTRVENERVERQAKIDAMEGLKEINKYEAEWINYRESFDRFIENDAVGTCPTKPDMTMEELYNKYPRATMYKKAEYYANNANYRKSALGREAMEAIINGEPYEEVINNMEKKWKEYCDEHIWD